jgi:DNA gyrase subunit A
MLCVHIAAAVVFVVIVVTRGGSIKRMPLKTFESQGRGTRGKRGTATTEEVDSEVAHCFTCNDHDTLLMVTQRGIAYGLRAYQVPIGSRTAKGQPIASVLPIKTEDDITTILPISEFTENEYLVLATEQGWIKKTPLNAFGNLSSRGLTIATLEENDRLKWCEKCNDKNDILIGTCKGKAVRFAAAKLHPTGRTSRGVHAMKLGENDTIADVNVLRSSQLTEPQDTMSSSESQTESSSSESMEAEYLLAVTSHGFGKRVKTKEFRTQGRGGAGNIAIKFKKSKYSNDRMSCLRIVKEDDEILVITAKGIMVRQQVADIPSQGRSASGVMIQKVDVENGDHISSVSLLPKYEEAEDILE